MARFKPTARKSCGGKAPPKQLMYRSPRVEESIQEKKKEVIPNPTVLLPKTIISGYKAKFIQEQAIQEDTQKIFAQLITLCIDGLHEELKEFIDECEKKSFNSARYLLIHNAKDYNTGYRPIDFAVLHGHKSVVECLLKNGAEIEGSDPWRVTHNALDVAIKSGNEEMVKFLHSYGAKAEHKLYLAISEGQMEIAKMLLKGYGFNKVDIDALSDNGFNALHLATKQNKIDIMKLLLTNGADTNKKSGREGRGRSALHLAAENYNCEIIECLVEQFGADVFQKDINGLTALDMVKQGIETLRLLMVQRNGF